MAEQSTNRKIVAMRAKLSMAKEMLEELLAERDEMERRHFVEISEREAELAAEERERASMRDELGTLRKQIEARTRSMQNASQETAVAKAKLKREAEELRGKLAEIRGQHEQDKMRLAEAQDAVSPTRSQPSSPSDPQVSPPAAEEEPQEQDEHWGDEDGRCMSPEEEVHSHAAMTTPASAPRSALKSSLSRRHNNRIVFKEVQIREFELSLGGGGGVPTEGSPVGLGWNYEDLRGIEIGQYEEQREGSRRGRQVFMSKGYLTPAERYQRLREIGFEDSEIEEEIEIVQQVQEERNSSVEELEDAEKLQVLGQAFMWWWMSVNLQTGL